MSSYYKVIKLTDREGKKVGWQIASMIPASTGQNFVVGSYHGSPYKKKKEAKAYIVGLEAKEKERRNAVKKDNL